jgi:succinyl-diaminopimelate desuccinylase
MMAGATALAHGPGKASSRAMLLDPIPLAQDLIRRRSVTPADDGALDVLSAALEPLGFVCRRYRFGAVDNLHAQLGDGAPHLVYCGHTDVVPVGDAAAWSVDPFAAEVRDGFLWGRGAADMKGGIAAFVAAVADHLARRGPPNGAISLIITGDEEGPAIDGIKALLPALAANGVRFTHGLGGEPTSARRLGDVVKNGRRGSLNAVINVRGRQGHVAYPAEALNPIPPLLALLTNLAARRLDDGAPGFPPSNLEVTTVDVGNAPHNVIPAQAGAKLNIRFNTAHIGADLAAWIEAEAARVAAATGTTIDAKIAITGDPFFTPAGAWTDLVAAAVAAETGLAPALTTDGGTSDCRFLKNYAPCVEFGLVNATIHQIDERAAIADIQALARIYAGVLDRVFAPQ